MDTKLQPQGLQSPLDGLARIRDHQARHPRIFPTPESLSWFIRRNRATLEERGALVRIAGRLWIKPDPFDQCVLECGALALQQSSEREAA